jgi:HNH endonuclease/RuvC endonuclease subdomain 3
MSIKDKISRATDANLHVSFDVGHSSIGWAVLQTGEQLEIKGCGSVVFRADDCLASSRRAYRRQRRHIRSTRQRIARMKILLKHLGILAEKELDKPGCAWPWKLAAQILQGGKLLTWPELWDVLRWYAHNRGYDGNQRWSKTTNSENEAPELDEAALDKILNDDSATKDEKDDAKKVLEAKNLMRRHNAHSMAETFCKELGIEPEGEKKSSMKRFKGLNAAFPRKTVETEVLQILQAHKFCDAKLIHFLLANKLSDDDRIFLKNAGIRLPKRYEGGLLFGQLVPRFDNRIISICPISGQKVPSRNCPEFLNFRWAMQLANIRIACAGEKELRPLTAAERKIIDQVVREKGGVTPFQLKLIVREKTKCVRDDLEQMLMLPDFEKALELDRVQKMVSSDDFQPFWKLLPERLQKRLRGKWRRGKVFTLAQIRTQLDSLGDVSAFDAELQRQLDAHNSKAKRKEKQITREDLLQKNYPSKSLKLDGRAAFARHLLKQAYEEVMAGKHPKEEGGCLFISEEIRQKELNREIAEQTNNHLVRHRLLILERLLKDIIKEYAEGKKERIGKITIEVNRDLREMSGMDSKAKDKEMRGKLGNIRAVEKYVLDRLPEKYHGRVKGNFLRKARIADDLDWRCPYTGEMIQPIHLMTGVVDLDHIIPYAMRPSNSLDSLVATFSVINKMKKKRTAMQFMKEMNSKPVAFIGENGKEERVEGMPNLSLLQMRDFKTFIAKLKIRGPGEHEQDKQRRLRRKELLEKETWEEKTFLPRDLTQTSQLVRLGAQVLRKNLPHLTTADIISLPGSVTGTVRKSWNLNACLELACPEVMEDSLDKNGKKVRQPKIKSDIRGITHLHHALDACVLGLASHFIPNSGQVWELITKRRLDDAEKRILQVLDVFDFNAENRFELRGLDKKFKEQIRQRLAEKRVAQHVPASMAGLPTDQNMWRLLDWDENGKAILEKHSRDAEGKRKKDTPKAGANNKQRLIGWNPQNGEGKLQKLKAVLVTNENFGVAILDHAQSDEDRLKLIPFHKVFPFIFGKKEEHKKGALVAMNQGRMPRILRSGHLIKVPKGTHVGTWRVFSVKNNADGLALSLGEPDALACRKDKQNVGLKVLLRDGFQMLGKSLVAASSCPTTSSA